MVISFDVGGGEPLVCLSVWQSVFQSICAELNRPAREGILEGKDSRLVYDCADVNGIIQMQAEYRLPAYRGCSRSLSGRDSNKTWHGFLPRRFVYLLCVDWESSWNCQQRINRTSTRSDYTKEKLHVKHDEFQIFQRGPVSHTNYPTGISFKIPHSC